MLKHIILNKVFSQGQFLILELFMFGELMNWRNLGISDR